MHFHLDWMRWRHHAWPRSHRTHRPHLPVTWRHSRTHHTTLRAHGWLPVVSHCHAWVHVWGHWPMGPHGRHGCSVRSHWPVVTWVLLGRHRSTRRHRHPRVRIHWSVRRRIRWSHVGRISPRWPRRSWWPWRSRGSRRRRMRWHVRRWLLMSLCS